MARGDVIADVFSTTNGSTTSIQPGSGVEWVIKSFSGSNNTGMWLMQYDGTNSSHVVNGQGQGSNPGTLTLAINNTNYAAVLNAAGGTLTAGYSGYITKD